MLLTWELGVCIRFYEAVNQQLLVLSLRQKRNNTRFWKYTLQKA